MCLPDVPAVRFKLQFVLRYDNNIIKSKTFYFEAG
jgi:hypothetical protein